MTHDESVIDFYNSLKEGGMGAIYFRGLIGAGKTFTAARLARRIAERGGYVLVGTGKETDWFKRYFPEMKSGEGVAKYISVERLDQGEMPQKWRSLEAAAIILDDASSEISLQVFDDIHARLRQKGQPHVFAEFARGTFYCMGVVASRTTVKSLHITCGLEPNPYLTS